MSGRVSFTPTQQDWVAANRLWLSRAKWRRWMRWFILAVVGLVAVNIALQVAVGPAGIGSVMLDLAVPVAVGCAIAASYLLTPLTIKRGVRRQFAQRRTMARMTAAEWNDEQLALASESGSTTVRWADLHRWLENTTVFAFLLTDRMILMVPKRAMTDQQIADLGTTAATFGPKPG